MCEFSFHFQVVFYHMMEVYSSIGINEIIVNDVINGVGSFFVVALGGTFIGESLDYSKLSTAP